MYLRPPSHMLKRGGRICQCMQVGPKKMGSGHSPPSWYGPPAKCRRGKWCAARGRASAPRGAAKWSSWASRSRRCVAPCHTRFLACLSSSPLLKWSSITNGCTDFSNNYFNRAPTANIAVVDAFSVPSGQNVNVTPYQGVANSFLASTHPPPQIFSGKSADWADWKRRCELHTGVLNSVGGGVPEAYLLSRLENCLDPPSRAEVRGWSEMGATYPIIWGKLCTYFEKDVEESSRSAWENLSFDFKGKLGYCSVAQFFCAISHFDATPRCCKS